jgi:hypothetical protein
MDPQPRRPLAGHPMSDPVRDTRQAVDDARFRLRAWFPVGTPQWELFARDCTAFEAAVEAWVLARERRETFARGDDATEARP